MQKETEESELEELVEEENKETEEDSKKESEDDSEKVSKDIIVREIKKQDVEKIKFREEVPEEIAESIPVQTSGAVSLERVTEGVQDVGWGRDANARAVGEEETSVSYSANEYKTDNTKYDAPEKSFSSEIFTGIGPDAGFAGRERTSRSGDFVFETSESGKNQFSNPEADYARPKRFEHDNREMPFEKKDKKYEEFKP